MTQRPIPPSFTQGYAIMTPGGSIIEHTYRRTPEEAIATIATPDDPDRWQAFEAYGCTVQFVYARIFVPQYFTTKPDTEGAEP
ncbi:hypothetical protein [Shinella sp. HZN7]|uniref:hypothetical protein n=1 Tax=Shinella sp. (strain HZN7) TaxID=879274 RepID=UPI0009FDB7DA|nr:hypothetical protein [Shinella sp. HZN7]